MGNGIERYAFLDSEGGEQVFTTLDPVEAERVGRANGWSVIAHTFEWSDSEPVRGWDFAGLQADGPTEDDVIRAEAEA
jgi:hypothetical protein